MEEIEAEMRQQSLAAPKPKPMTMEEIELDMRARQQLYQLQQEEQQQQQQAQLLYLQQQQHLQQQQQFASPIHHHAQQVPQYNSSPSLQHIQSNVSDQYAQAPTLHQNLAQNAFASPQGHPQLPRQTSSPFPPSALSQSQIQQQQQQQQTQPRPAPLASTGSFSLADMFPALPGQDASATNPSTDMLGALAGMNEEERAMVKNDMERKILEQEKADEKRKRKAWKIAGMVSLALHLP